jgi:hypothetical protein
MPSLVSATFHSSLQTLLLGIPAVWQFCIIIIIIMLTTIFFETSNLYTFSTRQRRQGLSGGEQGEANPGNQDIADCH